jgi:hypothetical protein
LIIRQGAHHGAQKSTITGTGARISSLNDDSVALVSQGRRLLHLAQRGMPSAFGRRRFLVPQFGHRTTFTA